MDGDLTRLKVLDQYSDGKSANLACGTGDSGLRLTMSHFVTSHTCGMQNRMQAHVTAKPHEQKQSTILAETHIHVTSMMGSHAEAAYVQYRHANRKCDSSEGPQNVSETTNQTREHTRGQREGIFQ